MARWPAPAEEAKFTNGGGAVAELARRLGERVKEYRARRGMSRKVLSQQSGVSERYLAQLEGGQANVSFQILWNLAQTMDTSIAALIEEPREESYEVMMAKRLLDGLPREDQRAALSLLRQRFGGRSKTGRVALIGLRGAGKTTLGRIVARHYGVPFIRLTSVVEQMAGMDMTEIFMAMGQKGYRRLEFDALRATVEQNPHAVIETGGSLVSEPATFDALLESCFTVWLQASPQEHMRRVFEQGDVRPMEGHGRQAMEDLRTILDARRSLYGRADAVLDTAGRSRDDCAAELIALCAPALGQANVAAR
jgi:XRE family aerobic/anaerobic benzoate catabolism transcriptional regulator